MPDPTLYLFDGYNLLHAGGHTDERELTDELASFVAMNGARGFVVFDGVGEEFEVGPLSVRYAPARGHVARAARSRAPADGERLPRLLRRGSPGNVGPGGTEAFIRDVSP